MFKYIFLWIFFQLLGLLEAYHWSGMTMYDLEYQGSSFDAEAGPWFQSIYWTSGVKTSTCDVDRIMGGYKVLGGSNTKGQYWERQYTGIPTPHNVVYLTIRIYPLDSWDSAEDDHFEIWFDSTKIIAWAFQGYNSQYAPDNLCGDTFKDLRPMWVYATVPHTSSTLTFRVVSSLNQGSNDESLGFRDITMEFQQSNNPPSSYSFCGVTAGNPLDYNACPCADGTYMYPANSGICPPCSSVCKTCFDGSTSGCLTCPDGRYQVGNTCPQCSSNCQTCTGSATNCQTCPTGWFMVGTTCYPTCDYPLQQYTVGSVIYCKTPCSGQYVWWDGTCSSTCAYSDVYGEAYTLQPVTVSTFAQCNFPCLTSQALYFNTSCLSSCPSPLTTIPYKSRNFCGYSCGTSQYLYWNGSCINTCPWPLSPETQGSVAMYQRKFCWYYCQPGEYMYWNGSCISTCPSPLTIETQGSPTQRKFCWYTCPPTQYLYWNGSCLNTCPWPLSPEVQGTNPTYQRNFCWYYCQPGEYMYWNGSCISTCPSPLSPETQGTYLQRKFCWYTCQPSDYLYWNGSCLSTCPWPLSPEVQGTNPTYKRNFCWYTCQPSQYLYWNGSCAGACGWPLVPETQGTNLPRQFCWYLCQPSQFLYWNGSCLSGCPWPLSPETQGSIALYQRNFCWYYCQPGEYMYWNGSCISTCPWPLVPETQGTYLPRQFCWYLCQPSQYLYWNGSCLNSCPWPLSPETQGTDPTYKRNFCWYYCQPSEYLYWNGSCIADCPSPLAKETQGTYLPRQFCWYLCQPNQYLYWNLSCIDSCPAPLTPEMQGTIPQYQRNFCWYTCQPSEFLLWNYTCSPTCPYPLTNEVQGTYLTRKFCWYPCMPYQWLNWDQTCQPACNPPLSSEMQGTYLPRQFCWYTCTSESKYLYWNGTCLPNCPHPLEARYQNGQWFCDYPCAPTGQFLYWNGSCLSTCVSPLAPVLEGTPVRQFCYYLCQPGEFLYWDGTCQAACNFPLTPTTQGSPKRQFCWYLCPINEFLYWNGTCLGQCPIPFAQRTEHSRQFCDYQCAANQYLLWNSTCSDTCPYPLRVRIEGDLIKKNLCDFPCASTEYLYWNGSCKSTCPSPLATRIEGTSPEQRKFCDYPCVGNQYLYWNGSCMSKCALPHVVRIVLDRRYCDSPCPTGQIMYWDGSCNTSCPSPLTLSSEGNSASYYCKYVCSPTQFLYWNGSCSDACSFPLTSYVSKGRLFCKNPCLSTEILHFNGSCLNSCPSPLITRSQSGFSYCDYPCLENEYLYWNSSCIPGCASPLVAKTIDGLIYCEFPCSLTTYFLYWNGSCSSQCSAPLSTKTEGGKNFCVSGCSSDQYLYWNSSCLSSCNSPLTQSTSGSVKFCHYPCDSANGEYLYWDGSCLTQCNSPLSPRTTAGLKYCDYPCSQPSLSLYWNGSCLPNCNSPLKRRTEKNKQFCDFPCSSVTDYLYWDSSCSSSCNAPLVSKTEGTRKFCLNTCDPSDYSYWNGSCFSRCPSPFRQKFDSKYRYCNPPCENNVGYYYEELKTCYLQCKQPAYIDNSLGYLRCLPIQTVLAEGSSGIRDMFLNAPFERNTVTFVKLVKSMQYVRYLDINMPPRLQRLGISKGRNVLSVSSGMQMGIEFQGHFIQQLLPVIYSKHELHSSFLVNYWEDLVNLIFAVGFALMFLILEKIFRAVDMAVPEVICQTLRVLTKWNFVIMAFAINIDDIILFSALEFKSVDSKTSGVSLALAIVFLGLVVGLIGSMLYLILVKKKKNIVISEDFQVLFNGFRDNSVFCQLFFILYMLRIGVPMALAVLLEISPLGNTALQVILSLVVISFLIIYKPFVKKVNHYQIIIFEALTLLMNCGVLALTFLSYNDKQNSLVAVVLGDFIIIGNDAINVMGLLFLIIKLHIESKIILNFMKKHKVPKKMAVGLWVQLLYIPLQLSHMGFEEMTVYNIVKHDPNVKEVDFRKGKIGKPKQHELQNEFDHASFDQMKETTTAAAANIEILNTDRNGLLELSSYRERNQETVVDQSERLETFGDNANDMSVEYHPKQRRNIFDVSRTRGHDIEILETNSNFIKVSDEAAENKASNSNSNGSLENKNKYKLEARPSKGILKNSPRQQQLVQNFSENGLDDTISHVGMNSERSLYNDLQQLVSRNNSEDVVVSMGSGSRVPSIINSSHIPTIINPRIQPLPSSQEVNQNVSEGISSLNTGEVIPEEQAMKEQGSLAGISEVKVEEQPSVQLWQAPRKLFKPKKKKNGSVNVGLSGSGK